MSYGKKATAQVGAYLNQLLISHFLEEKMDSMLAATDDDMLKYYEANTGRFQITLEKPTH